MCIKRWVWRIRLCTAVAFYRRAGGSSSSAGASNHDTGASTARPQSRSVGEKRNALSPGQVQTAAPVILLGTGGSSCISMRRSLPPPPRMCHCGPEWCDPHLPPSALPLPLHVQRFLPLPPPLPLNAIVMRFSRHGVAADTESPPMTADGEAGGATTPPPRSRGGERALPLANGPLLAGPLCRPLR